LSVKQTERNKLKLIRSTLKITIILSIFLQLIPLMAADKHGGDFLRIGIGAATVGRGETGLNIVERGTEAWWNPALLSQNSSNAFALQHSESFGGALSQDFIGWSGDFSGMHTGFYLIRQAVDDIPLSDRLWGAASFEDGGIPQVSDRVTASDLIIGAGIGRQFRDKLDLGLSLKIIYRDLGDVQAAGLGLDLGLSYKLSQNFRAAARARDVLGSVLFWDDGEFNYIMPELAAGISWLPYLEKINSTLKFEIDLVSELEGKTPDEDGNWSSLRVDSGLEFLFFQKLAIRGGFADQRISAGAGLVFNKFQVDYAWRPHTDLGDSHLVFLSAAIPRFR
jgi:hypothetical protein